MTAAIIYWFRQDLRLADLPGLAAAAAAEVPVIPCFILDETSAGDWAPGAASRWWLHHSLGALGEQIAAHGGQLVLRRGDTGEQLQKLARETGAAAVYCSRQHEPLATAQEQNLHRQLEADGVELKRHAGALLFEPELIRNQSGLPFKVFTPFWRKCRTLDVRPQPAGAAKNPRWYDTRLASDALPAWSLLPQSPDWAARWLQYWQPGTAGARARLDDFLSTRLADYSEGRDFPARKSTTQLSAHLHFGEISPREVWHTVRTQAAEHPALDSQVDKFLSELGWRDFSHHLLHHFPDITDQAFKAPFRQFPWMADQHRLRAWQQGQTGYPIVDAGMRELWQTGYMHNRVRMVVASFLTKHLLIHWREGARWFWDTLIDADLANNSCSWQWVAGSGADASPYFRIFNPITQGEKFDPDGTYIRQWVPEVAGLPDRYLNRPWEAPQAMLEEAGVVLDKTYPAPIVDHREAREAALAAYGSIRGS